MQTSKFIKVNSDILIEYIYTDDNLVSEQYKVLVNIQDNKQGFMSGDTSSTNNTQTNSLFELDSINRQFGLVDTTNYNFLQIKDFASGQPIRYDKIRIHLPINYTFDEFQGLYLNISVFNFINSETYVISNFYFHITNINQ